MAIDLGYSDPVVPGRRKKPIIGYGAELGLDYYGEDDPVEPGYMPLAERNELLEQLGGITSSAVGAVGDGLDWLGSNAREGITGKKDATGEDINKAFGINPSAQALGGYGRPIASFMAEVATDPLSYTGFGILGGGINKAGKAAKAANILDDAARAMSRTHVDEIINGTRNVDDLGAIGRRTRTHFLDDWGKEVDRLTDDDLYARPIVGRGEATRNQTLGELLERQRDYGQGHYDEAVESLRDHFTKKAGWFGDADAAFNSTLNKRMANDLTFGIPFTPLQAGVNLPFGDTAMRAADNVGDILRWSTPGRWATSAFDRDVHGATDAAAQVQTKALSRGDRIANAAGRRESNRLLSILPRFADEATDIRMGNAIRNVIEEVGPTLRGDDLVAHNEVLQHLNDFRAGTATGDGHRIGNFIDEWLASSEDYLRRSREAGIGSHELNDTFGTKYFPRILDDAVFDKGGLGTGKGGKTFSVMTGDQLARGDAYHVPGGTQTLRELSLDPMVAGAGRSAHTDEMAASHILRVMDEKIADLRAAGNPLLDNAGQPIDYSRANATELAKTLRQVSQDAIDRELPMFGQHPAENIAKYIGGRERAIRRSNVLYDALASSAIPQHHTRVPGGGRESIVGALNDLDLRTVDQRGVLGPRFPDGNLVQGVPDLDGARVRILERLNAIGLKNGIPEFSMMGVNGLDNVSVDSRTLQVMQRVADFYEVPEVQSKFFKVLDAVTSLWKSSILSWPSRFIRDWYSGMFSNLVMVQDPRDMMGGYAGAKYLIQGQTDRLDQILMRMPRYSRLGTMEERVARYTSDLAAEGISTGRQLADVGQTAFSKQSSHGVRSSLMAGADPETTWGYMAGDALMGRLPARGATTASSELLDIGNWGRTLSPSNIWKTGADALAGKKSDEIINPILRWSARLGDTTDKLNRIAGYNGLLLSGMSPGAAAKMVMEHHVDYSSLTKFERGFIRNAIPFWAYQSRIGKWAMKQIVTKPGGAFTQMGIRLPRNLMDGSNEGEYVPSRIANKYGISLEPLRNLPGGKTLVDALAPADASVSSWISDIDLPGIDQINMIRPRRDAQGNLNVMGSAADSLMSLSEGAHPLLKSAVELGTGRDAYTGLKKNYARSTLPTLVARSGALDPNQHSDLRMLEGLGHLDTALQFGVPFYSRGAQLARRATDPRLEDPQAAALQSLFNMFTGTKIENIDDTERTRDAMDKISQLLDSDPAVRSFETTYIPKDLLPTVDPRTAQLYQLQRQINKERRQKAKLKPEVYNPLNY
jgi:hypothetical protein